MLQHIHNCKHDLKYCSICDVVYCTKCKREWGGHGHTNWYPYYPYTPWNDGSITWTDTTTTHNHS